MLHAASQAESGGERNAPVSCFHLLQQEVPHCRLLQFFASSQAVGKIAAVVPELLRPLRLVPASSPPPGGPPFSTICIYFYLFVQLQKSNKVLLFFYFHVKLSFSTNRAARLCGCSHHLPSPVVSPSVDQTSLPPFYAKKKINQAT